jgi:membrane protein
MQTLVIQKYLKVLAPWLEMLSYIAKRFIKDECIYRATALTFTTLLSLMPLMTTSFAIISAFPVFSGFARTLQDFIFANFVPATGVIVEGYLQQFISNAPQLSIVSFTFLLITAVTVMYTIEQSLNIIWRVPVSRKGMATFLLYWSVLTLPPILLACSVALTSYVSSVGFIMNTAHTFDLVTPILTISPVILSFIAFSLLYIVVPNCYVPYASGLTGALVATILFESAKYMFAQYVIHFPNYKIVYGALSVFPLFLIWLFLSWLIILFGAIVSHVHAMRYWNCHGMPLSSFLHAYRWIGYFWEAQKQGSGLNLHDLIAKDGRYYQIEPDEQLATLVKSGLIAPITEGRYMLCCDMNSLTLLDLYNRLPWQLPLDIDVTDVDIDPDLHHLISEINQNVSTKLAVPLTRMYQANPVLK